MDTLPIFPYIMRVNLVLVLVGAWVIPAPSCSSRSVYDLYISNSFRVLFSSLSNKKGSPLLVPSPRDLSLVSTLLPSPPSSHSSTPSPVYGIIDALHGFPEHCHRQKQCLRDICRIWIRLPRKVATSSVRNFHSMNSWPGIFFCQNSKDRNSAGLTWSLHFFCARFNDFASSSSVGCGFHLFFSFREFGCCSLEDLLLLIDVQEQYRCDCQ